MNDKNISQSAERPILPKRVVITAGMPYGNKELHFGHIGGVFVHADIFARFMRDRIGKENVIFISGIDCYGSPIVEHYERVKADNEFSGTIEEFVKSNHEKQKETLRDYWIDLDIFAASSFNRSGEIHAQLSKEILEKLYENDHLIKLSISQFYDPKAEVFLTGRQVTGQCPIEGCQSENGYADECSLGHQYTPKELINPKSTLTGEIPEMRNTENWYIDLNAFKNELEKLVDSFEKTPGFRPFVSAALREFFEAPTIHVKTDQLELLDSIRVNLPQHTQGEGKSKSVRLVFKSLGEREKACALLTDHSIRFRNGKTLTPFRLTGNIEWGVTAPEIEGLSGLTFWVWPESLWAPISFTKAYLEGKNLYQETWKDWWCSKEARVYQFIGEDNVYFYGLAEMAIFMGLQGKDMTQNPDQGNIQLPILIVNNHILFLDKKASSSDKIKPPMADELLLFYTSDQLRAHFCSLGLGMRSVSFRPKPFNSKAHEKDGDPVLKEGNLLSNVLNRAVRSCFYTTQEYYGRIIPSGSISKEIIENCTNTILNYEKAMSRHEFHEVMKILDTFIRGTNKIWSRNMKETRDTGNKALQKQTLIDMFHMVRTAVVLMHPIAPEGTEKVREYLNMPDNFFYWENIFEPIYSFMDNPEEHRLKELPPHFDFFEKHPSQIKY